MVKWDWKFESKSKIQEERVTKEKRREGKKMGNKESKEQIRTVYLKFLSENGLTLIYNARLSQKLLISPYIDTWFFQLIFSFLIPF